MTQIFKAKHSTSQELLNELFLFTEKHYAIRSKSILKEKNVNTVYFGSESISSLAPKIYKLVPDTLWCLIGIPPGN